MRVCVCVCDVSFCFSCKLGMLCLSRVEGGGSGSPVFVMEIGSGGWGRFLED